jgi:hypothetical protein
MPVTFQCAASGNGRPASPRLGRAASRRIASANPGGSCECAMTGVARKRSTAMMIGRQHMVPPRFRRRGDGLPVSDGLFPVVVEKAFIPTFPLMPSCAHRVTQMPCASQHRRPLCSATRVSRAAKRAGSYIVSENTKFFWTRIQITSKPWSFARSAGRDFGRAPSGHALRSLGPGRGPCGLGAPKRSR